MQRTSPSLLHLVLKVEGISASCGCTLLAISSAMILLLKAAPTLLNDASATSAGLTSSARAKRTLMHKLIGPRSFLSCCCCALCSCTCSPLLALPLLYATNPTPDQATDILERLRASSALKRVEMRDDMLSWLNDDHRPVGRPVGPHW